MTASAAGPADGPAGGARPPVYLRLVLFIVFAAPPAASFLMPPPGPGGGLEIPGGIGLPCFFRILTGIPCPFCGLSRSFVSLAHLRPADAVLFHPLGPALFVIFTAAAVLIVLPDHLAGRTGRLPDAAKSTIFTSAAAAAFLAAWIAKLMLVPSVWW